MKMKFFLLILYSFAAGKSIKPGKSMISHQENNAVENVFDTTIPPKSCSYLGETSDWISWVGGNGVWIKGKILAEWSLSKT